MSYSIVSLIPRAWEMLSRYAHVLSGITWIGLLYFFNFVQTPAFAEMSAEGRTEAQRKITWRALWWFRWAALAHVPVRAVDHRRAGRHGQLLLGQRGTAILTGMLLGVMFLNVWGHLAGAEGDHRLGRTSGPRR